MAALSFSLFYVECVQAPFPPLTQFFVGPKLCPRKGMYEPVHVTGIFSTQLTTTEPAEIFVPCKPTSLISIAPNALFQKILVVR